MIYEIYKNGELVNTIVADAEFVTSYCEKNGYTYELMSFDHEEAMRRLHAYNHGFKQPMSEAELEATVCSAVRKGGYKYTNAKLIELLAVTPEEQDAIGLHPFTGVYKPWNHAKPNATRDAVRKARKDGRDGQIIAMHREGISQAETARELKISRNTVAKVLKEWREQVKESDLAVEHENLLNNGAIYDCLLASPSPRGGSVSTGDEQGAFPLLSVVKGISGSSGDGPPGTG